MLFVLGKKRSFGPRYLKTRVLVNVRLTFQRFKAKKFQMCSRKVQLLITRNRGGFRGGEAAAAAAPPLSSSDIFFLSKYTMILSFYKQAVGTFYFFS